MNGLSFIVPDRAAPLANYPHMRKAGGLLFVSGLSSRRPDGRVDGIGDIKEQTRAVLRNLEACLKAADAGLEHVVDVTVFLLEMTDYAGMNEVWNKTFTSADTAPTRTTLGVKSLPGPHLLIEIKAIAVAP